jgi:hypothetical protein
MNEIDVLKSIAQNLSKRKGTAALSNYKVLCSNIKFANDLLHLGVDGLKEIQKQVEKNLSNDDSVVDEAKDDSKPEYYFRNIVPTILLNDISVLEKFIFYTQADDRTGMTIENIESLKRDFINFNNLVTAARQFIDSLVADAYQLVQLDPKETNFQVLTSLSSFYKFATKSIVNVLFHPEVEDSLEEFENLTSKQRFKGNESNISKCAHNTFAKKIGFLFNALNLTANSDFQERLKNLFKFSSEFTHIGYVSTFFTSSDVSEIIFDDGISPYLSSTENFSELKYEILETAIRFYTDVYLPIVIFSLRKMLEANAFSQVEATLNQMIVKVTAGMATRNNSYLFPVKSDLIGSAKIIELPCRCGTTRFWKTPHEINELFCENCGSKFNVLGISGEGGYIMTSEGLVRVVGSNAPQLNELERAEFRRTYLETDKKNEQEQWSANQFLELAEEKRLVLTVLAAFGKPCPLDGLKFLLPQIPHVELENIVVQLKHDNLICQEDDGYQISPLIRACAYNLVSETPQNEER